MKRVLVTGACSQVGSRVVRQLLARNYDVRGLVLPGDAARSRLDGLDIEVMEGNLLDMAVAPRTVDGARWRDTHREPRRTSTGDVRERVLR